MGMTEPSAGTDVLAMSTTARRDGDHFILNGRKTFITNAPEADLFVIYAKVEERVTSFLVERAFPGFATDAKIHKMGMRASTMCEIQLDDCMVPAENVLGTVGGGIKNMMRNLEIERLTLAAMSLGIADRCLDIMTRYAGERTSFGKPLAEHGQIQRYLAESYAKTEAMRALIYTVARGVGPGSGTASAPTPPSSSPPPPPRRSPTTPMQVLGGWGYCTEYKVERFLRDAKLLEIGGGTLESHQKNITKELVTAACRSKSSPPGRGGGHQRARGALLPPGNNEGNRRGETLLVAVEALGEQARDVSQVLEPAEELPAPARQHGEEHAPCASRRSGVVRGIITRRVRRGCSHHKGRASRPAHALHPRCASRGAASRPRDRAKLGSKRSAGPCLRSRGYRHGISLGACPGRIGRPLRRPLQNETCAPPIGGGTALDESLDMPDQTSAGREVKQT